MSTIGTYQYSYSLYSVKWSEKPLILWRSGTQYSAMATKIVSSYCRAPLVEIAESSDTKNTDILVYHSGPPAAQRAAKRSPILIMGNKRKPMS